MRVLHAKYTSKWVSSCNMVTLYLLHQGKQIWPNFCVWVYFVLASFAHSMPQNTQWMCFFVSKINWIIESIIFAYLFVFLFSSCSLRTLIRFALEPARTCWIFLHDTIIKTTTNIWIKLHGNILVVCVV